jgi:hypothetical protein
MSERTWSVRFSAQHDSPVTAVLQHLLSWLVVLAGVTVLVTGAQLVVIGGVAAGLAAVGVAARWLRRKVRERREDAADEIEGARWWAEHRHRTAAGRERVAGETGRRELTR